jgi:hypothetical protein
VIKHRSLVAGERPVMIVADELLSSAGARWDEL